MLTKAVAPAPLMNSKLSPGYRNGFLFGESKYQNWTTSKTNSIKWRRGGYRRRALVVRGGYTRRPMETPGAYQLIDDETGEKLIIWGDADHHSPIPPKHVLHWKPVSKSNTSSNSNRNAAIRPSNSTQDQKFNNNSNDDDRTTSRKAVNSVNKKGLSRSFGRLKAQRVRDLVRGTSSAKKVVSNRYHDENIARDAPFDGFEPIFLRQNNLDVLRDRTNIFQAKQSKGTRDVWKKPVISGDKNHSRETSEDSSVSRVSAASLRGWNYNHSASDSTYGPIDVPNKWTSPNNGDFFSRKSFRDLGCSDFMIESLKSRLFVRPSHIQAMAFVPVIEGKSCIIADQSGSGKTLAYLLPVIQLLRQEELQGLGKSVSQNPRVVVLVPTAELASQVLSNCRLMSKFGVPFRSMVVTGGFRQKTQVESLRQDLDVLIATPGRFTFLVKEGFLHAVLDEVDVLFNDEDFEPALQSLVNSSPVNTQYLFVTATLPVNIFNDLVEVFPDCEVIMGPGMHRTSPGLEEILVDCSGDGGAEKTPDTAFSNKKSALLQLVERSPVTKTIVFCNKASIETCRKVENALKRVDRKGIRTVVLPFHAALAQESRLANIEEFRSSQVKDSSLFLVCTDRASRGIDFVGVDRVVLFDFPRDPSEYVRRVGRTARGAGGKGTAFIFAVGKQVSLARRIIERNRKGHPLHDLPSTI
ncbi:hypothetical protein RJ639_007132 [Escallonia herrerae]|uniref:RNA helicase n=1 Tax=Escallonia herrerae TaxID=1293975 RepID=A0AA88VZQ7_9ASTE|nr:hypothetical protein RJ639_007132 [Escallonia herrerae]